MEKFLDIISMTISVCTIQALIIALFVQDSIDWEMIILGFIVMSKLVQVIHLNMIRDVLED